MRTSEELGRDFAKAINNQDEKLQQKFLMEVLLDVRDLLVDLKGQLSPRKKG